MVLRGGEGQSALRAREDEISKSKTAYCIKVMIAYIIVLAGIITFSWRINVC
jgi:hypothetical protein